MKQLKNALSKACNLGMLVGAFALTTLSVAPGTAFAHNSHHSTINNQAAVNALALNLEGNFYVAVQNQNIAQFSAMVSRIFQGLYVQFGTTTYDRDGFINSWIGYDDITGFNISDLYALRNKNVLTVSYDLQISDSSGTSFFRVVSVWQKSGHRKSSSSESHHCHGESWLLVSQNTSNITPN